MIEWAWIRKDCLHGLCSKGFVPGVIVQCRRGSKGPGLSKVSIFAPFKPMASKIWAIFACAASTGLVLCPVYKFYQPSLLCHHRSGLTISSNEGGLLLGNSGMDAKIKQRTNSDKQQQLQSVLMCPAHSLSLQCIPTTSLQLYISATWILCLKLSLSLSFSLSCFLSFLFFCFLSPSFVQPYDPTLADV